MLNSKGVPGAAAALLVASLLLPALGGAPASAQVGNASLVTQDICGECHGFEQVSSKGKSRFGWNLAVWRMEAVHGCSIDEGEREAVLDHLAENYPRREGAPSRDLMEYVFGAVVLLLAVSAASLWFSLKRRREG